MGRILAMVVVVGAVTGAGCSCSESHGLDGGRDGSGVPVEGGAHADADASACRSPSDAADARTFLLEFRDALCEAGAGCPRRAPLDVARCRERPLSSGLLRDWLGISDVSGVESGNITWSSDAAERCLESVRGTCPLYDVTLALDRNHICRRVFDSACPPEPGASCSSDVDCPEGQYCPWWELECPTTCRDLRPAGDPCTYPAFECAAPATGELAACAGRRDSTRCYGARLERPSADGGPCALVEEDDSTLVFRECEDGLICLDGSLELPPEPGRCASPREVGDSCTLGGAPCETGAWCDASSGTCERLTNDRSEGDLCYAGCEDGLVCFTSTNTCAETDGTEGAPCDINLHCTEGLFCDLVRKTCVPRASEGERCTWHFDCQSGCCAESDTGAACAGFLSSP